MEKEIRFKSKINGKIIEWSLNDLTSDTDENVCIFKDLEHYLLSDLIENMQKQVIECPHCGKRIYRWTK
jgi:hypothetical protein